MPTFISRSVVAGLVSLAFAAPVSAAVTVNFVETSTGVNASFLGSLDLTGADIGAPGPGSASFPFFVPNQGIAIFNTGVTRSTTFFGTPAPYGSGGVFGPPTTVSGDVFGLLDGSAGVTLLLPEDFSPTKIMMGSATFDGATFASLGIEAGTFVTTLSPFESLKIEFGPFVDMPSSDTITIIATPVPEPGTYALMLAGLGVVGFMARRRQNPMKGAQA